MDATDDLTILDTVINMTKNDLLPYLDYKVPLLTHPSYFPECRYTLSILYVLRLFINES